MIQPKRRSGVTLIEIIAAVVLVSVISALGIRHVRSAGVSGKSTSCELCREALRTEVVRYEQLHRQLPSSDLRELRSTEFWSGDLPTCPESQSAFRLDRDGNVVCQTHPSSS